MTLRTPDQARAWRTRPPFLLAAALACLAAWLSWEGPTVRRLAAAAAPATLPDVARTILETDFRISPGDMRTLLGGGIVGRTLDTSDPQELAAYGAARLALSKEAFFDRYRDVIDFKRHEAVRQIGRFGNPPSLEDVLRLTFEPEMLDDLRNCRPANCKVKLTAAMMARLRTDVRWNSPAWRDDAEALLRQELVGLVTDYVTNGESALPEYVDKKQPLRLADQFRGIIDHSPYLARLSPEFARYLVEFPAFSLPVVDSFVYWSKEAFGLKPVVSVTHVVVYRDPRQPEMMIGASKQLYAMHYFEASLGLTIAIDGEPVGGAPTMYLLYVNRSRTDALRGAMSGLRRRMARGRADDGVKDMLRALRDRLEADAAAGRPRAISEPAAESRPAGFATTAGGRHRLSGPQPGASARGRP